jgi:hypothetical protein
MLFSAAIVSIAFPAIRGDRRAYCSAYPATHNRAFATAYFRANGCTDTATDCTAKYCVTVDG